MSLYSDRREPIVMIRVNGVDAPDLMEARLSYRWTDRIGKRQNSTLVVSDPDRKFRDGFLQPDDHYQIAAGYPGNLSRVRNYRLKEWTTNHDASPHKVTLELKHTGSPPKQFQGDTATSEPHKTFKPRNWGKIQTSEIAKRIARRHGLKPVVDDSEDIDRYAYTQPANVSDFGYLRRLSEVIDFEFFIDGDRLYYRKKPYDERPRRVFYYHPQGGRDTLLLKFTPKAKVTVVSVSPKAVDVQAAETPWIADEERRLSEEAADIFNNQTSDSEAVVKQLTAEDIPDGWNLAKGAQFALETDPNNASKQDDYDLRMRELDLHLRELQAAKRSLASNKKGSGKAAHVQGSKPIGSQNKGDRNCPSSTQKSGSTPTGTSPVAGFEEVNLRSGASEVYGASQATMFTTAGSDAQRGKVACAAHSKRKDKAVTATADFIGDPSLVAKVNYRFEGVGPMFSGDWYAKEATHTIGKDYRVTMDLKRGKLKKVKKNKGTTDSQSDSSVPQHLSEPDQSINLRTGETAIWSQTEQERYNASMMQSSEGYYTSSGLWVSAPKSTAVPGR